MFGANVSPLSSKQLISLTTHDGSFGAKPLPLKWGARNYMERGPVLATVRHMTQRNAIGAHSGGCAFD